MGGDREMSGYESPIILKNARQYYSDMPSDAVNHYAKAQARELLDAALGKIEKNTWYAIKMSESDFEPSSQPLIRKTMTVEIKKVWLERVEIRSAEELMLTPSTSFRTKLKNCISYMRDKTGGRIIRRSNDE